MSAPSIGTWLADAAARAGPGAGALVAGEHVTWRGLDALADRTAAGFRALALPSGAPVCVLMRSSVATLGVWFGLARAGLLEVPLNVATGSTLLRYLLEHSGASVVVCDAEFEPLVRRCAPAGVHHVVVHGPGERVRGGPARHDLADLTTAAPGALPEVDPCTPAVVLYTSGTTGPPKAALPLTPSQRVEKYKLRAEGLTPDTWDRDARR